MSQIPCINNNQSLRDTTSQVDLSYNQVDQNKQVTQNKDILTAFEFNYTLPTQRQMKIIQFVNGIYQGHVDNEEQLVGIGCFFWRDSQIYYGDWKNNQMHGKGIMVFPQGGYLCGYFKDNLAEGKVKLVFPNQDVMYGYCRNGLFDGRFLRTFKQNNRYLDCQYVKGNLIKINREITYYTFNEMIFKDFKELLEMKDFFETSIQFNQETQSTMITTHKENIIYDEFNNQMKLISLSKEEIYFGAAKLDIPKGLGVKIHLNQNIISRGRFSDGVLNGRGRKNFQNGDIFDGGFNQGNISNSGIFYNNENQRWFSGYYENNKLITLFTQSKSSFPPCLSDYESFIPKQAYTKKEIASQCIYFTEKEALFLIQSLHQLKLQQSPSQQLIQDYDNSYKVLQTPTFQQQQQQLQLQLQKQQQQQQQQEQEQLQKQICDIKNQQSKKQQYNSEISSQKEVVKQQKAKETMKKEQVSLIPPLSRKGSAGDVQIQIAYSTQTIGLNCTQPLSSQYNSNSTQNCSNNVTFVIPYKEQTVKTQIQHIPQNHHNNSLSQIISNVNNPNPTTYKYNNNSSSSNLKNEEQDDTAKILNNSIVDRERVDNNQILKDNQSVIQYSYDDIQNASLFNESFNSFSKLSQEIKIKDEVILKNISKNTNNHNLQENNKNREYRNENMGSLSVLILESDRVSKSSKDSLTLGRTPNFMPQQQNSRVCDQFRLDNDNSSPSLKKDTFPEEVCISTFSRKEEKHNPIEREQSLSIMNEERKTQTIQNGQQHSVWIDESISIENKYYQIMQNQSQDSKNSSKQQFQKDQQGQQSDFYSLTISNFESINEHKQNMNKSHKAINKDQSISTIHFNSNSYMSNCQQEEIGSPVKVSSLQENKQIKSQLSSKLKQILQSHHPITICQFPLPSDENQMHSTNLTTEQSYSQQQFKQMNSVNQSASNQNLSQNLENRFSFSNQSDTRQTLYFPQFTQEQQFNSNNSNEINRNNNSSNNKMCNDFSPILQSENEIIQNKENQNNQNQQKNQVSRLSNTRKKTRVVKVDLFNLDQSLNVIENNYQPNSEEHKAFLHMQAQSNQYQIQQAQQIKDCSSSLQKDILRKESEQNTNYYNNYYNAKQSVVCHRRQSTEYNNIHTSSNSTSKKQSKSQLRNRSNSTIITRKQSQANFEHIKQQMKMGDSKPQIFKRQLSQFDLQIKKSNQQCSTKVLKEISKQQLIPEQSLFQKLKEYKLNMKMSNLLEHQIGLRQNLDQNYVNYPSYT